MSARSIRYRPHLTGSKFHASPGFVRGIRGPIGSGKSVTCVMEMFRIAKLQRVYDGKRKTRWAAVRNTYPELKSTTIRTFQDWFPGEITKWRWDSPISAVVTVDEVEMEVWFLALDTPADVKKLKSLELTGVWLNEASELAKAVLDMATGRVGRYPAKKDGGSVWSGVIMDTNPPDTDHWWYKLAEEQRPKDWAFFAQPAALLKVGDAYVPNPMAENIENHELGFGYYLRQIEGKKSEWIKVFILGQYGAVMDGKPVYAEYRDDVHCSGDTLIEPLRGLPLLLGWDFGRTPACIVGQLTPRGKMIWLEELIVETDSDGMGIRKFAREVVKPHLAGQYNGMSIGMSLGDPAGIAKGDHEQSSFDILDAEGIPTEPAPSNAIEVRLDAVRKPMMTMIDGEPGFLINGPKMPTVRKGFLGGYRYTRIQVPGEERYKEVPDKNKYSHPHDAGQYLAFAPSQTNIVVQRAAARIVKPTSAQGWT